MSEAREKSSAIVRLIRGVDYPADELDLFEMLPPDADPYAFLKKHCDWPREPTCPNCKSPWIHKKFGIVTCSNAKCRYEVRLTEKTIYHGVRAGLHNWIHAAWYIAEKGKGGWSINQFAQKLRISQALARRVLEQYRRAMATANDFQLSGKVIGGEIQVHLKKGKGQNNEGSVGPESRILFALELPGPTSKGQIRMSATVSTHLEPDRMAFIKKVVSTTATVIHLDPNGGGGGVKGKHRMETLDKDLKEWIKSAHASSVNLGNLQPLLEEFTFFRNQKQGCSTGLVFRRLIECAMKTPLEKKKRIA